MQTKCESYYKLLCRLLDTVLVIVNVFLSIFLLRHTKTHSSWFQTLRNASRIAISSRRPDRDGTRPLVIWNADAHPAPVADIRQFVEPMGVRVLQHDLSRYCHHFNVCEGRKRLKVLNPENVYGADSAELQSAFYAAYKDDPVMKSVDAFLCTDVVSTCQLYMQFNKTIIIVATNRYHVCRENSQSWTQWNNDLKRIAADPRNVIAANNVYDVRYMRFFTGIEPIHIPSYCGYTNVSYNSTNSNFLFVKSKVAVVDEWLVQTVNDFCKSKSCQTMLQPMPPNDYRYSDLTRYRGIVHIPYQISTMSIFEQYRMNIPLIFPSKKLLVSWEMEKWVVRERIRPAYIRYPPTFPNDVSQGHLPSPIDNHNAAAVEYWLQFADYYTMPYIQYFDSVEHLADMMCRLTEQDLRIISERMRQYNVELKRNLSAQWEEIFVKVAAHSQKQQESNSAKVP